MVLRQAAAGPAGKNFSSRQSDRAPIRCPSACKRPVRGSPMLVSPGHDTRIHAGATPKLAPASFASFARPGVRMVPTPTVISGTSARMRRTQSSAASVRSREPMPFTPPSQQRLRERHGVPTRSIMSTAMTPVRWSFSRRRWGRRAGHRDEAGREEVGMQPGEFCRPAMAIAQLTADAEVFWHGLC